MHGVVHTYALVEFYSEPDPILLQKSHGTVWSCSYEPGKHLGIISAKSILSVVAMVPHKAVGSKEVDYFLVEKPGLDVISLTGYWEPDEPEE